MIEPLRFATERAPPHIIDQAVFCGVCLADRKTRKNPKVASKYCHDCFKNNYMCLSCDAKEHGLMKTKNHVRSLLVVGPPVRKKVLTRGDAKNFPMFLDDVKIKFKARIYDNGKLINRTPARYYEFLSGQSGDSIHVQVLGCRGLLASDAHGSSDPFISAVYCGVPLGMTRTRHRTINPKWTNETYVVPCGEGLPPPREESFSQKNLLRLEVYDRDYVTSNDFLGHVELSRKKLIDMAAYSNGQPLNINLTARHHHGTISVRLGTNGDILYIRVVGGESLEKTDGFGLSDPFCKVYFKGRHIGTTPVCKNTITPKWTRNSAFAVELAQVLDEEDRIKEQLKQDEVDARRGMRRGGVKPLVQSMGGSARDVRAASTKAENEDDIKRLQQIDDLNQRSLFVLELYDYNNFNPSQLLGHIRVPVEALRKLVPILPGESEPIEEGKSVKHMLFRAKSATGRFFRGEEKSARMSGKWASTPSAKGYNDETPSEKAAEFEEIETKKLNSSSQKTGLPTSIINRGEVTRQMSSKVGDVSDALMEEDEEEDEESRSPKRSPPRPSDAIKNIPISELLGQEIEGGSSYASGSQVDGESSLTSGVVQGGSVEHVPSMLVPEMEDGEENAELLAPQRSYNSLSKRPGPPPAADLWEGTHAIEGYRSSDGEHYVASRTAEVPLTPTNHGNDCSDGLFENVDGGGSLQSNGQHTVHSNISASEKALDAMYSAQMDGSDSEDDGQEERHRDMIDDEHVLLPSEMLQHSISNSNSNSNDSDGSEFDENVPNSRFKDKHKGEMGDDGVFLEENEALLGKTRHTGRRRSSLFQTMVGTLGFVSAEDFVQDEEDSAEEGEGEGEEEGIQKRPKQKSLREKKSTFADNMRRSDYDNSCFRAIKRAFFGEVRWSQVAFFPVVKYKLSEEDLDCNRGEIVIRVLRSNRGKVLRGLDSGVRNMSLGETAQIKVRYDRAYSSFTMGTFIPPRANIVFTAELLTINGNGRYGMPARQLKRIFRFFWKIKERVANSTERLYWRAKKRYLGVVDITGPPDSYYDQGDDEESFATSTDSLGGLEEEDDDDGQNNGPATGAHIGAKIMWGFHPEKRPVRKKKVKTEYEKLLERQKFLSEKKSIKAQQRKNQKLLMCQESAQMERDKLLNMGLGDDVDMDYQLGPNASVDSSHKSLHDDGPIPSYRHVDQTDDLAMSDVKSTDGHPTDEDRLKLDLGQVDSTKPASQGAEPSGGSHRKSKKPPARKAHNRAVK